MALKRLMKEYEEIQKEPIEHCTAEPIHVDNWMEWKAFIKGPSETPYHHGKYELLFLFPSEYPFKPPRVSFITKIYHPNINSNGSICLDILKDAWSPALTVSKILLSISSLLAEPNPEDPLVPDIARTYKENYEQYVRIATEYNRKYASSSSSY